MFKFNNKNAKSRTVAGLFKRKKNVQSQDEQIQPLATNKTLWSRMYNGLGKTRVSLFKGIATIFAGRKKIDEESLEELEAQLIAADIGVDVTNEIMTQLTTDLRNNKLADQENFIQRLKLQLQKILEICEQPLVINEAKQPYVILALGVNGVGKTTTLGKMAAMFKKQGKTVMLAAGDTFRAAAIEQLQTWGQRNQIPVISQKPGSDSASVVYDAYNAAKARKYDVLLVDTAGRLHNKDYLMEELKKIKRILGKQDITSPHEILLVLDAGVGQNAISQTLFFHQAVQLTGLTITKLDGTAKGGIIFPLAKKFGIPIRFIGVGEQLEDLQPFSAKEYVNALFAEKSLILEELSSDAVISD